MDLTQEELAQKINDAMDQFPWCAEHWTALATKFKEKGLGQWLYPEADESPRTMLEHRLSQGDKLDDTFDPMLGAWHIINEKLVGASLFTCLGSCPICYIKKHSNPEDKMDENWLEGVTDDARTHAVHEGLVPDDEHGHVIIKME